MHTDRDTITVAEKTLFLMALKELVCHNQRGKIEKFISKNNINWERFRELLIGHELHSLFYPVFSGIPAGIPEVFSDFLKNNFYCGLIRCQKIWDEFLMIRDAFKREGIIVLPIKGVSFLWDIYPDYPARAMTDIDLLIKEEELLKAEEVFRGLGYRKELYGLKEDYWRRSQYHIAYYRDAAGRSMPDQEAGDGAAFIELHWSLDYKRRNQNIFPELWGRFRQLTTQQGPIEVPSPEDALFSLALHNRRFGNTLCLKNVFDLALLLDKYGDIFDWGYVFSQCRRYRMRNSVFFILQQVKHALGLEVPAGVLKELRIPSWKKAVLGSLIEKETFSLKRRKDLFLKLHFLIYDSIWEPVRYVLFIPQEQFAKFYGLKSYGSRVDLLYRIRILYMPYRIILSLLRGRDKKDNIVSEGLS